MSDLQAAFAKTPALQASLISLLCLLRGLPLFFRASPQTPLRVLGIIALDTLHVLRYSRPLPRTRISELAMFLDLEGCANAAWDHKRRCEEEYETIRQRLEHAGLGPCLDAYLCSLREIESHRPPIGGDRRRFDEVRAYREGVARLSLSTAAEIALGPDYPRDHRDVDTLFLTLMQCQVIDDVLDYDEDVAAGLPSFLTAAASLPLGFELTAASVRRYAAGSPGLLPLRVALTVITAMATVVVQGGSWWFRVVRVVQGDEWQIRRVERKPGSR
jgi:hypothetical protein